MRLFIGVFLPQEAKKQIKDIQEKIGKLKLFDGKFAETDNLHLTLKFLGEVEEKSLKKIEDSLINIKNKSIDSHIDMAGLFTPSKPKIVWLHIGGCDELQKKVDSSLESVGFKKEDRFMSHITIARIKFITPINAKKVMDELKKINMNLKFKIKKFSLIESELSPHGPKYKVLKDYDLAD